MGREDLPIIRASELGDYEFCARAWWLRRALGWQSRYQGRLVRGEQAHAAHGRAVSASSRLVLIGAALIGLALVLLALA